jgi:hypothetical protein
MATRRSRSSEANEIKSVLPLEKREGCGTLWFRFKNKSNQPQDNGDSGVNTLVTGQLRDVRMRKGAAPAFLGILDGD